MFKIETFPTVIIRNLLSFHFSYSCGIDLGNGQYVVTGGMVTEDKVTQYNETGYVRTLPNMKVRRYNHACASFKNENGEIVSREINKVVHLDVEDYYE